MPEPLMSEEQRDDLIDMLPGNMVLWSDEEELKMFSTRTYDEWQNILGHPSAHRGCCKTCGCATSCLLAVFYDSVVSSVVRELDLLGALRKPRASVNQMKHAEVESGRSTGQEQDGTRDVERVPGAVMNPLIEAISEVLGEHYFVNSDENDSAVEADPCACGEYVGDWDEHLSDAVATVVASLLGTDRCVHSRDVHRQHHFTRVDGCPWCVASYNRDSQPVNVPVPEGTL